MCIHALDLYEGCPCDFLGRQIGTGEEKLAEAEQGTRQGKVKERPCLRHCENARFHSLCPAAKVSFLSVNWKLSLRSFFFLHFLARVSVLGCRCCPLQRRSGCSGFSALQAYKFVVGALSSCHRRASSFPSYPGEEMGKETVSSLPCVSNLPQGGKIPPGAQGPR